MFPEPQIFNEHVFFSFPNKSIFFHKTLKPLLGANKITHNIFQNIPTFVPIYCAANFPIVNQKLFRPVAFQLSAIALQVPCECYHWKNIYNNSHNYMYVI